MDTRDRLAELVSPVEGGDWGQLARDGKEIIDAADLQARVDAIARHLPEPTPGSEVAFSFGQDRLGFLAALLAAWSRGHAAALPADAHRDGIVPLLARPQNAAFLHDTGVGRGHFVPDLLRETSNADGPRRVPGATPRAGGPREPGGDRSLPALLAFRQPALGEAQVATWTFEELQRDLDSLGEALSIAPGEHVVSSLTPTAVPGLLLGLLAPRRRGATFSAATRTGAGALADQVREERASVLVATPAHARGLLALAPGTLAPLTRLFAVDEGLDPTTAARLAEMHGLEVVDVPPLPLDVASPPFVDDVRSDLLAAPEVSDASVEAVEGEDGSLRLFVAVVASEQAGPALRKRVEGAVPAGVEASFRTVPALPRDANGRLPAWRTALLFRHGRRGHELRFELSWSEVRDGDAAAHRFRTRVPREFAFFEGHYTSRPILAGGAQLDRLVLPCIRRIVPEAGGVERILGLKFLAPIGPEQDLEVVLQRGPSPRDFRFEIRGDDTRFTVGRLRFAPPAIEDGP